MYAVTLDKVAPGEPSKSGLMEVHYFVNLAKAKTFAKKNAKKYTHISIFEEIGDVSDGEVSMSSKFERANPHLIDNGA